MLRLLLSAALVLSAPAAALGIECPSGTRQKGKIPPHGTKVWCALPDGTQHGPSLFFHDGGEKRAEAHFENGELDGLYREWYPNGKVAQEVRYDGGKKAGMQKTFYEDGAKWSEETWVDGLLQGKSMAWYPSGKPRADANYEDGKRDGEATSWWENGQVQAKGTFVDGKYDGKWVEWREDGRKRQEAVFDRGDEKSRETFP